MSEFARPTCAHCTAWTKRKPNGTYERYCTRHVDGTPCATKGCDTLCHRKHCKEHAAQAPARTAARVKGEALRNGATMAQAKRLATQALEASKNGPVTVRKAATTKAATTKAATTKAAPKAINNRDAGLVALQAAMEAMAQAIALLAQ